MASQRAHLRLAYGLVFAALFGLLAAGWLPQVADRLRVVGIAALLLAPWTSLLAPGGERHGRWPWALGLLLLFLVAFFL